MALHHDDDAFYEGLVLTSIREHGLIILIVQPISAFQYLTEKVENLEEKNNILSKRINELEKNKL